MAATAEKTNPQLWEKVKKKVTAGDKGGRAGQWSARKAQEAVAEYKKAGGGYRGRRSADNHLAQWTREDWGTKSGRKSKDTGERYLPRKAREKLSDAEYARTTAKKRADTVKGKQFSAQPRDVARKAATARKPAATRAAPKAASTRPAKPATRRPATRRASPAKTATKAVPRRATAKTAPKRAAARPAAKRTTKAAPARRTAAKPAPRKAPARKTAPRARAAAPRRTPK